MKKSIFSKALLGLCCVLLMVATVCATAFADSSDEFNPDNIPVRQMVLQGTESSKLSGNVVRKLFTLDIPCDGKLSLSFNHDFMLYADEGWRFSVYKYENSSYQKIGSYPIALNDISSFTMNIIECKAGDKFGIKVDKADGLDLTDESFTIKNVFTTADKKALTDAGVPIAYITPNDVTRGTLSSAAEKYYRINASETGKINMTFEHTTVNGSTAGWDVTLYKKSGSSFITIGKYSIKESSASNFEFPVFGFAEGDMVYVKVEKCAYTDKTNAEFRFNTKFTKTSYYENWVDNTFENAKTIMANAQDNKYLGGLMDADDANYYYLSVTQDGILSLMLEHASVGKPSLGWSVSVFKKENNAYIGIGNNGVFDPYDGEYYLSDIGCKKGDKLLIKIANVGEYAEAGYYLHTRFTAADYFEKELNDSFDNANDVTVGKDIMGALFDSGDVDVYRYQATKDGAFHVGFDYDRSESISNKYWKITVYKEDAGKPRKINSYIYDSSVSEASWFPYIGCSKGDIIWVVVEYYVSSTGTDYIVKTKISSTVQYEKEFNNTWQTANAIDTDSAVCGHLYSSCTDGNDEDWYMIDRRAGEQIQISFMHETATQVSSGDTDAWVLEFGGINEKTGVFEIAHTSVVDVYDKKNVGIFPDLYFFGSTQRCYIRVRQANDRNVTKGASIIGLQYKLVLSSNKTQIVTQPKNYSCKIGDICTFSVEAKGENLRYTWFYAKESGGGWYKYTGSDVNESSISFKVTKENYNYVYYVFVGGYVGDNVSSNTVRVKLPLTIISQPENVNVIQGESAVFSIKVAGGEPLANIGRKVTDDTPVIYTYKWQYRLSGSRTWTDVKNSNSSEVTIPTINGMNGALVRCTVTDGTTTLVSSSAKLEFTTEPLTIIKQPEDVCVTEGQTAKFTIEAEGYNVSYQWQFMLAGATEWKDWAGKTAASLYVPYDAKKNGMQVRCKLTDGANNTMSSNVVMLKYKPAAPAPVIVRQPADVTVYEGHAAIFSVAAEGENLTYQWQYMLANTTAWKNWDGKTDSTLKVPYDAKKNGMSLRCVVTNADGVSVTSETAVLKYIKESDAPVIVSQPVDAAVEEGKTATFTIKAEGSGLTYQWQFVKGTATEFKNWDGKTSATLSIPYDANKNGMRVRCVVTNGSGVSVTSNEAKLTYVSGPKLSKQPVNVNVAEGHAAAFSVTATGNGLTYQWQYKLAGSTAWKDWSGKTTATIKVPYDAKKNGMSLRCVVTDNTGRNVTSQTATLSYTK